MIEPHVVADEDFVVKDDVRPDLHSVADLDTGAEQQVRSPVGLAQEIQVRDYLNA